MTGPFSHAIGFDDAPFLPDHRGDVAVVGAVYAGYRLEGVLCGKVRRDGANATAALTQLVLQSRFRPQLQVVLLQGIALAGFNVIDLPGLSRMLALPVVAVARRQPDLEAIKQALLHRVRGGQRKWALLQSLGPMEAVAGVFVQRSGISLADTGRVIERFAVNSKLPEPIRTAHLIAAGLAGSNSRHRA